MKYIAVLKKVTENKRQMPKPSTKVVHIPIYVKQVSY